MDSHVPLPVRSSRPKTILDTLKNILDEHDPLTQYLPQHVVEIVDYKNAPAGHGPHRIKFGVIEEAQGSSIEAYAYMATSTRQKDVPDIHFYGRQLKGPTKRYPQEDITLEGELDVEFQPVKDISSPAFVVLLQCLFILKGVAIPSDCTISARFISEARSICYRFKNHRAERIGEQMSGLEDGFHETATSFGLAPISTGGSSGLQSEGDDDGAITAAKLITQAAHKRPYSSMSDSPQTVGAISHAMSQSPPSAALDLRREYAQFTRLHEQKFDSKIELGNIDSLIAALLRARHEQENMALIMNHKFELHQVLKTLKEKHDAETQALSERHLAEAVSHWQEPTEDNAASVQRLSALHDQRSTKMQDLARLEAEIERQHEVLLSSPNVGKAVDGEIQDNNARKRMKFNGDEEGATKRQE